jgi:sugar lactone lactonase YvrE
MTLEPFSGKGLPVATRSWRVNCEWVALMMKLSLLPITALFAFSATPPLVAAGLEEVASFPKQQVTGVGVSVASGRVFVNFPFWSDDHTVSVAEIKDGKPVAFPDETWNTKEGDAAKRFVCVQSVVVDSSDFLWALDAGSPKQEGVIAGGAKLVKVDLKTNAVAQVIPIEDEYAPKKSYLNDVRFDLKSGHAFITESGIGSIIVVDLKDGTKRRFLANHPSTKMEVGKELVVDGIKPIDPATQGTPQFQADGIALDAAKGILYFHALTADTLYQVPTSAPIDPKATDEMVGKKVTKVGKTPAPDGMLEEKDGGVLLAAFEKNAIVRVNPESGKATAVVEDKRLQWPDTLSWGPEGYLYITTSQIHRTPKYNQGVSKLEEPFKLFRIKLGKE